MSPPLQIRDIFVNLQNDHLPVGLIVQLVEHCAGLVEVKELNPVEA